MLYTQEHTGPWWQSSGAVWKLRWPSWAPVPNKPTVSVDVKQHFNNNLCTLYLPACQVRVTVGESGLCCCTRVTSFDCQLAPLGVDTTDTRALVLVPFQICPSSCSRYSVMFVWLIFMSPMCAHLSNKSRWKFDEDCSFFFFLFFFFLISKHGA